MKNVIFYFSSTGNSLYISKKVAEVLDDCMVINMVTALKNKDFLYDCERIGFVAPIYASGIPPMAYEFISNLVINKSAYVFGIECSGGGTGIAFTMMNEALKKGNNPLLKNGERISFRSNYIRSGRNHPVGVEAKKVVDDNNGKIKAFSESVKNKAEQPLKDTNVKIQKLFHSMWRDAFKNKDKGFNVNETCTGCGICEKICPTSNITLDNHVPVWNHTNSCCDCMGCINNCPHGAINIGKKTIKKNRYRNPYIKANELFK